jgi:hypothetical protein
MSKDLENLRAKGRIMWKRLILGFIHLQKQKKNEMEISPENINNEIELIDSPSLPKESKKISFSSTTPFSDFSKIRTIMGIVKKTTSGATNSGKFIFEESTLKENKSNGSKLILAVNSYHIL